MVIREAVIQGGQLVLDSPLPYRDGTRVQVRVEAPAVDPLQFLADNAVATGVSDLAERHGGGTSAAEGGGGVDCLVTAAALARDLGADFTSDDPHALAGRGDDWFES